MIKLFKIGWPMLLLAALSGCETMSYYVQSINGQWEVTEKRRPVDAVIHDRQTPDKLQQRLELSKRIRQYAISELALPDNGSYRYYTDLKRSRVVWNVFAAPTLSLMPKRWCFPVAGCVSYRGYFNQQEAEAFAQRLDAQGFDVLVRGITAYSTLGWFNDPLLNTFIYRDEPDLAGHIFHELAHQVVYVKNDTAFNESFAMALEEEGVRRWLSQNNDAGEYASWQVGRERSEQFIDLLLKTRHRLLKVYSSDLSDREKLSRKREQLTGLKQDYADLKKQWGGSSGLDGWFTEKLNNAFFVPISEYYGWLPAFRQLLSDSGSFQTFYQNVKELAALDKGSRDKRLSLLKLKNKNTAMEDSR